MEQAIERWKDDYEKRKTPEQIAAYQKRCRDAFVSGRRRLARANAAESAGCRHGRRGRAIASRKIIFESQPKHYVTGLLFLPDAKRFKPPYPGVLVPCGHAFEAKGYDAYQAMGALLALNGMAALVFDPIDQGERGQYMGKDGWPKLWGIDGHTHDRHVQHPVGPQHGSLRNLGRHEGDRLPPIAARGRSEAHRLHRQ